MRRFFNNQSGNKKDEEKPLKAKLLNYRKNKKQTLLAKETQKQNLLEQQKTQINRNVSPANLFEKNQPPQQQQTNQNQQTSTENVQNNEKKIKSELLQLPKPAWRNVLENFGFDILDNYPMRKWREFCSTNPLMCWIFTGLTWAICQYLAAKAEFGFVFLAIFLLLLILLNLGIREEGLYGKKLILNNVFGVAYPGEVLALMGASGAGKTSLLNILTQRNLSSLRISGQIRINGVDVGKNVLRKISAYVQQEDLFIGSMTVIEHLRFMAIMRMGRHYSARERERRVQGVIAELGLKNCANTLIGWPNRLKGLSGGERKRLAFASEIMTGPPILFCDEPTSGLDSYLAKQVIQVLKDLARRKNMTIIVTIHQPSSQLFEMFDKICLLAEGKLAFLGTTAEAIPFFESLGHTLPDNFNPADFFIGVLADAAKAKRSRGRIHSKVNKICSAFTQSDTGKQLMHELSSNTSSEGSSPPINTEIIKENNLNGNNEVLQTFDISTDESAFSTPESVEEVMEDNEEGNEGVPLFVTTSKTDKLELYTKSKTMQRYKSTWLQQFRALLRRSFFVTLREPMLLKVKLFQTLLISIILGTIYFQTPIRQTTVMNINGLIFQSIANMNFMFQFAAVHIFCDELPIFMREHLSSLYRVDTYFIAKNIAELIQYIIYPFVFSSIVYWMSGFVHNSLAYASFVASCVCVTNVAISLSYAASCIFGTTDLALAMLPVVVIPLLAFGGFYINQQSLPSYFYPIKFISYFGYAFESAAISQWTRVNTISGCNQTTINMTEYNTCYLNGMDVLDSLGFDPENIIFDYTALISMILGLRLVAFFALWLRAVTKK